MTDWLILTATLPSEPYAELLQSVKDARKSQELQQIQANDFFPGKDHQAAADALAAVRREIELHLSPDEPASQQASIEPRQAGDFQGRTWATRKRPWVDRLAHRLAGPALHDRKPTFLWLADARKCPEDAVGHDFDGATFTHVGEMVTFEVVARTSGLDESPAMRRLGGLVHTIDVGGIPLDEAPGLEMLVRGLQARHEDDDALLKAGVDLFDTIHAALSAQTEG